jgi:hypothetical protein
MKNKLVLIHLLILFNCKAQRDLFLRWQYDTISKDSFVYRIRLNSNLKSDKEFCSLKTAREIEINSKIKSIYLPPCITTFDSLFLLDLPYTKLNNPEVLISLKRLSIIYIKTKKFSNEFSKIENLFSLTVRMTQQKSADTIKFYPNNKIEFLSLQNGKEITFDSSFNNLKNLSLITAPFNPFNNVLNISTSNYPNLKKIVITKMNFRKINIIDSSIKNLRNIEFIFSECQFTSNQIERIKTYIGQNSNFYNCKIRRRWW